MSNPPDDSSSDLHAGLFILALGLVGAALATGLPIGTLARPGGGLLPMIAAIAAILAGAAIVIARARHVAAETDTIARRPIVATLASALVFAAAVNFADLAAACIGAATCGALAFRLAWQRVVLIGPIVGLLGYAVFGVAFAVR